MGIAPDGTTPRDAEAQADVCMANVRAVLKAAPGGGLGMAHLVRINAYVTDRAHLAAYMRARDRVLAAEAWPAGPPASTLMVVSGFARPEFLVEVEAVAAA